MKKIYITLLLLSIFTGNIYGQAPGNTCATAIPLILPAIGSSINTGNQTTCGRGNNIGSGFSSVNTSYGGGEDAYYSITVPAGGGNYTFSYANSGATWKILSIHTGCAPTTANTVGGFTTGNGRAGTTALNLAAGTYILVIDTWPNPNCGQFNLTITRNIPPTCANNSAFGTVAAPTNPTPLTISTCTWQTEYNTLTGVTAGATYQSTYSLGGFITVRSGTFNGPIVASGNSPLTWTAEVGGNHFVHYNTNSSCGTATNCGTSTITCTSCAPPPPGPCIQLTPYLTVNAPTTPTPLTISACTWAGEYNTINNVVSGQTYEFSSSVGSDWLTLTDGLNNPLEFGTSPITWTATFSGTVRLHVSAGSNCATQNACRSTTVTCTSCAPPCPVPSNNTCASAPILNLGANNNQTHLGTGCGSTTTIPGATFKEVWVAFTVPCGGMNVAIDFCGSTPVHNNAYLNIFPDCSLNTFTGANNWNFTSCGDGNIRLFWNNVPEGTYYYPILIDPAWETDYVLNISGTPLYTPAVAPTSISGTTAVCPGQSTTLTLQGGSPGTNGVAQWFAGSCGSTVIGTGNSITVSPTVNTTYFVRYAGSCNTTSCATVTVNVNQPSTAPTITAPTPVCSGTEVTLTATGGTAGTGSNIYWYNGPNGTGGMAGVGATLNTTANSTQTFYARRQGTCGNSLDASFTIVADAPQTLGNNADSRTCVVNQNSFVHFTQNGRLIASVNSNGQNLGNVTAISYVHGSPLDVPSCDNPQAPQFNTAVLGRSWVITPTNQPSSDVTVRLYFDINEYNALESMANSNQSAEDDVVSLANLMLTKYHNSTTPALVNNSPLDNCPSGQSTIHGQVTFGEAATAITGFDDNGFYTEYTIPSFSEFWLHGSSNMTPLPVTLTYFDAYCDDNRVNIVWQTASENNSSYFVVQKSEDGQDWREVGKLNAAGYSNAVNNYKLEDMNFTAGATYYRLFQVDLDGQTTLYDPIMSDCEMASESKDVVIYPNPTVNESQLRIMNAVQGKGIIQVVDLTGKVLTRYDVLFENAMHYQTINANDLAKGSYMLHVSFSDGSRKAVSFVKQ